MHVPRLFRCVDTNSRCILPLSSTAAIVSISSRQSVSTLSMSKTQQLIIAVKTRRRIYYFADIRGDEEDICAHISRASNSSGSRPLHGQAPVLLLPCEWFRARL